MYDKPAGKIINPVIKKDPEWFFCSNCGRKLFKIYPNARAEGILFKCKGCKEIIEIKIEP